MLDKSKAQEIFKKIKKLSSADDVEVLVVGGRSALTRFANNAITQNVSEENYEISVRSVFGSRTARASTNKWNDEESLRRVVQSSEQLARVQEEDTDLAPMVTVEEAEGAGRSPSLPRRDFEQGHKLGPLQRAEHVARMVAIADRRKLTAAGTVAVAEQVEGIFNSRGVARWHKQSHAESSVTMIGATSSGWQKANSPDVSQFDSAQLAEVAAQKAEASVNPLELAPGKYTVILEPSAVQDLVGFMFWDFGGLALLDQRSFLSNRIGTKLFGENITVFDDVYHPLQSGAPFDGEGVRRERVELIRNGVVKNLVYARATARRIRESEFASQLGDIHATGHGFPLPNEIGEIPMNIVFENAGDAKSVEQMVSEAERAVLVTRLWYIREVDPYEKILTGMTRDGTFLVEKGKIGPGILNFRFNQSLIHMLQNVIAMGKPVRASGEESFDMVAPPMMIGDFNFTEVTKF